jgi:hypothetical protein
MGNKGITKAKVELMEKIIRARLTKDEMRLLTEKAQDILFKRVTPKTK